ncbi:MAG: DUF433 domain-containing protein [Saprospiraceae bacterium]|nr:DUF433 domain-containing protein [Saprospiraceae bacterium]
MNAFYSPGMMPGNNLPGSQLNRFDAISIHPEVQDGAPVFSGTRVRIETFFDYIRIGVSVTEFLDEFPSITRDQALEVYALAQNHFTVEQIASLVSGAGPQSNVQPGEGRMYAAA